MIQIKKNTYKRKLLRWLVKLTQANFFIFGLIYSLVAIDIGVNCRSLIHESCDDGKRLEIILLSEETPAAA